MRFLHVTHRYLPVIGGSEQYIHQIASRQVALGHSVTVITTNASHLSHFWTPKGAAVASAKNIIDGVSVVRTSVKYLPFSTIAFPLLRRVSLFFSKFSRTQKLAAICMNYAPYLPELISTLDALGDDWDIVFGWNITFDGIMAQTQKKAKACGAKFIATPFLHLGEDKHSSVRQYYTMPHQLQILKYASKIMVQTQTEKLFLESRGISKRKIIIVGAGISPDALCGGDGHKFRTTHNIQGAIITAIGPLTHNKGTPYLLKAHQKLLEQHTETTLVLVGTQMADIKKQLAHLPLMVKTKCLRLGTISEDEKKDLLAATDILILPSRTESFGIVLLEAWMYGKPVIGATAGAIPDVINDKIDGYLVPFGDVVRLIEVIIYLLKNPQLAKRMGERGRQKVLNQYTWNAVFLRFMNGVDELLTKTVP